MSVYVDRCGLFKSSVCVGLEEEEGSVLTTLQTVIHRYKVLISFLQFKLIVSCNSAARISLPGGGRKKLRDPQSASCGIRCLGRVSKPRNGEHSNFFVVF